MEHIWNGMEWSWNPYEVFHVDSIHYSMDSMDSIWNDV